MPPGGTRGRIAWRTLNMGSSGRRTTSRSLADPTPLASWVERCTGLGELPWIERSFSRTAGSALLGQGADVKTSTIRTCLSFLGCGIALATMAFAQPSAVDLVDRQPIDVCEIATTRSDTATRSWLSVGFMLAGPTAPQLRMSTAVSETAIARSGGGLPPLWSTTYRRRRQPII
jgi:hypothetical protein